MKDELKTYMVGVGLEVSVPYRCQEIFINRPNTADKVRVQKIY